MTPRTDPEDDTKRRAHVPHTSGIGRGTPQDGTPTPTQEGHLNAGHPGDLEHRADCPGARIVRRDAIHFAAIACTACGARVRVPIRREWTEPTNG